MIINGPICYFKLKKGNKEICLFGDIHKLLNNHHENGKDISLFIKEYLEKNKKYMIDVMLEENQEFTTTSHDETAYLSKINNMFSKLHKNNPHYKFLRIHYVDIREKYDHVEECLYDIIEKNYLTYNNLSKLNAELKKSLTHMNKKQGMYDKLLNNYRDKHVQKIINKIFTINCYKKTKYVIHKLQRIIKKWSFIQKFNKVISDEEQPNKEYTKYFIDRDRIDLVLMNDIINIQEHVQLINMFYMDCYFLRRFLDKPYVTKCLIYAGLMHILHYIYILINKLNYEIIEIDYYQYNKISFTQFIKNMKSFYDINTLLDDIVFKQYVTVNTLFD